MKEKLINTFKMCVLYYKTSAEPFIQFIENKHITFPDIQCNTDPSTEPNDLFLTTAYLPEKKPIFYQKTSSLSKCITSLVPNNQSWTFFLDQGFEK